MTQEEKLAEAKKLYQNANADQRYVLESLFPELKESEGERIRKEIITFLRSKNGYMTPDEDWDFHNRWLAWLEKQNEQPTDKIAANHLSENPCSNCTNTKGCIICVDGDQKSTSTPRILYSDEVIEWLNHRELSYDDVVTTVIPDDSPTSIPQRVKWLSDEFIDKFKKDFKL